MLESEKYAPLIYQTSFHWFIDRTWTDSIIFQNELHCISQNRKCPLTQFSACLLLGPVFVQVKDCHLPPCTPRCEAVCRHWKQLGQGCAVGWENIQQFEVRHCSHASGQIFWGGVELGGGPLDSYDFWLLASNKKESIGWHSSQGGPLPVTNGAIASICANYNTSPTWISWNKGISLPKRYLLGAQGPLWRRYNLTRCMGLGSCESWNGWGSIDQWHAMIMFDHCIHQGSLEL